MNIQRYEEALIKVINDVGIAILELRALKGLRAAGPPEGFNFYSIARIALFRDMNARLLRVLDAERRKDSFWYLYRYDSASVTSYANTMSYHLHTIDQVFSQCRKIQETLHLRLDRDGSFDPEVAWEKAEVSEEKFARVIEMVWDILRHLYHKRFGRVFPMPDYDGSIR